MRFDAMGNFPKRLPALADDISDKETDCPGERIGMRKYARYELAPGRERSPKVL